MKIEIRDSTFYILQEEKNAIVSDSLSELIEEMKKIVKNNEVKDQEKITILEVDIANWRVKQISWNKIAMSLIKGGEKP